MGIEIFELSESVPAPDCEAADGKVLAAATSGEIEIFFSHLQATGIELQRYGLDSTPLAFAAHPGVAERLHVKRNGGLPGVFIDGKLTGQGRSLRIAALKRALVALGIRV
ncbi:MAG: arsenic metallochaperone ArsD family protein [Desulfuromonadales bacterium]|nr:arsenic metallochaperone ArsD family protein [Desulfuromonadales bacterium]